MKSVVEGMEKLVQDQKDRLTSVQEETDRLGYESDSMAQDNAQMRVGNPEGNLD